MYIYVCVQHLSVTVQVAAEHARLEAAKSKKKAEREQRMKIPCMLAKAEPTYVEYNYRPWRR